MTEQQVQKKIITFLEKEYNAYVVKIVSANKKGVPDILACIDGSFVGIEVKRYDKRNTLSRLQQYNLEMIEKRGGIAFVACDTEEVENNLKREFNNGKSI